MTQDVQHELGFEFPPCWTTALLGIPFRLRAPISQVPAFVGLTQQPSELHVHVVPQRRALLRCEDETVFLPLVASVLALHVLTSLPQLEVMHRLGRDGYVAP